jgi:hypothetical protein
LKIDRKRWTRYGLWAAAVVLPLYAAFLGVLYHKMRQPPEVFGAFMKHVPMPAMLVVPFESMWNRARDGTLRVGDAAPDFTLATADGSATVRLADFRGQKPVALVFGSYT